MNVFSFYFFTDDALEYLLGWTEQFELFHQFSWVDLKAKKFPDWNVIKSSFQVMSTKTSFDFEANSSKIFEQYGLIKHFCTDEKISEWNTVQPNTKEKKISTESRWVEIFKHMDENQLPFAEFAHLIEFILCVAGTSAPAERIFANVNNAWTKNKSSLQPSTLKAMLMVKNIDYDCCEFYEFLQKQPGLLKKIASQEKYDFKNTQANVEKSPGAMSVDTIPED